MDRADLTRRLAQLKNLRACGELTLKQYRYLRRGAAVAYAIDQPIRRAARRKVRTEREQGRLQRPGVCEDCGRECQVEGHHPDYSKPLEIRWLCAACHDLADLVARTA